MIIALSDEAKAARAKVFADFEARRETSSAPPEPKPEPKPPEPRKTFEEEEAEIAADRAYMFEQRAKRMKEDAAAHAAAVEEERQRQAAIAPGRARMREELEEREEAARQSIEDAKLQPVRELARTIAALSQTDRDQLAAELVQATELPAP